MDHSYQKLLQVPTISNGIKLCSAQTVLCWKIIYTSSYWNAKNIRAISSVLCCTSFRNTLPQRNPILQLFPVEYKDFTYSPFHTNFSRITTMFWNVMGELKDHSRWPAHPILTHPQHFIWEIWARVTDFEIETDVWKKFFTQQ